MPTFVTEKELIMFAYTWGWVFPLLIVVMFLSLYRFALWRKIKDENKKRKDLTNISHRSNGHHKHKVHE